jgi:hypothetical protein
MTLISGPGDFMKFPPVPHTLSAGKLTLRVTVNAVIVYLLLLFCLALIDYSSPGRQASFLIAHMMT